MPIYNVQIVNSPVGVDSCEYSLLGTHIHLHQSFGGMLLNRDPVSACPSLGVIGNSLMRGHPHRHVVPMSTCAVHPEEPDRDPGVRAVAGLQRVYAS